MAAASLSRSLAVSLQTHPLRSLER